MQYDLGHLAAFDSHPVDQRALNQQKEKYLKEISTQNAQLLIKHIFDLPMEKTEDGPQVGWHGTLFLSFLEFTSNCNMVQAQLPAPTSKLPRMRPVPEQRPATRWEKFAREKGIKNQKHKSQKVFDEEEREWKPVKEYKKDKKEKDWLVEVKPGDNPYDDPFEKKELEKKQKVVQNQLNRVKNLQRNPSSGAKVPAGIPTQLSMEEGKVDVPTGQGKKPKGKPKGESLDTKQKRLRAAQVSTASIGKFDAHLPGEPTRPRDPKKRKRMPVEESVDKEHQRDNDILRKVLHGSGEGERTEHAGVQPPTSKSSKKKAKSNARQNGSSAKAVSTPTGSAQAKKKQKRATASATAKKSGKGKKGKS